MIPFFRRIRKTLADDNKPIKYLRYTIGEIVLVVIGILIALSINNWNEQRKNQDDVHLSLFQILNDLKQEELFLQEQKLSVKKSIDYLTNVSKGNYNAVHLDSLLTYLDLYFYFFKNNNAYSGLKATGKFSNINNPLLKANIASYYEEGYETLIADTQYGEAYTNNQVVPYVIANLEPDTNYLTRVELVLNKLKTTNLKYIINYQIGLKNSVGVHLKIAIQNNNKLITQIETELKNQNKERLTI
ncbi:MAG TPA: DUF6090 family protein [Yeosuana sp.]